MAISTQSFTQFVSNAVTSIQGAATALVDLAVGSILRSLVEACAAMALWLQGIALQIAALTRFASSSGTDADSWAADFGFSRLAALYATGPVTFSRFTSTNQATIPVGTLVQTADGTQQFAVIADPGRGAFNAGLNAYIIAAGTASAVVSVQSVNAASAANVTTGSISVLSQALAYVDTVNNGSAMVGGADPETDTAFKARFVQFIASLSRATKAAISFAIQSLGTKVNFTITENQSYGGTYQPGYFYVVVDDGTGSPSGSFLSAVGAAIEAVRGETITYGVFAPTISTANIVMVVTTAAGYTHAVVVAAVSAAITAAVNALPIDGDLPYTFLTSIAYGVPGVVNVTGTTINSGTADLIVSQQQIIKLGTLAVS